jgi:hypothetical protein
MLALVSPGPAQTVSGDPFARPSFADGLTDSVAEIDDVGAGVLPPDWVQSPLLEPFNAPAPRPTFLSVAYESLFGDAYSEARKSEWHPLSLRTFFTDGWLEPFIDPPAGTGGAPRNGWVNSFEGSLFRAWFISFAFAENVNHNGNRYLAGYTIWTPLSRRFEFRIDVPFVVSNKGGASDIYHDRFGDMIISPRFLLSETQDFGQLFALNVRVPTGSRVNGNGAESVSPHYQCWYNPFGNWAVRGGTGVTVPTSGPGASPSYFFNIGVGRYWKGADLALFRHQWLTLVANFNTLQSVPVRSPTYSSLTPGYRVQILSSWFLLAGLELPLTSHRPFAAQPIFLLLKDY